MKFQFSKLRIFYLLLYSGDQLPLRVDEPAHNRRDPSIQHARPVHLLWGHHRALSGHVDHESGRGGAPDPHRYQKVQAPQAAGEAGRGGGGG